MFRAITMSDSNYFPAGQWFLRTRERVKASFVLYGPDLTDDQIYIIQKRNIEYKTVDPVLYKTQMQFLKFSFLAEQIKNDENKKYSGFTFLDNDTFFVNDWSHVFDYDFDFGITVRNDMVNAKCLRAYANGGVMFVKHNALDLFSYANYVILAGKDNVFFPEYDTIWNTLETGRPKHKTHYRTTLRWWCDQVFLSAIVLNYFNKNRYHKVGLKPVFFDFNGFKIGLFGCDYYNVLDSKPTSKTKKNIYIRHLKSVGREALGVNKTMEKI